MTLLVPISRESRLAITVRRCKAQTLKMEIQQLKMKSQRAQLDETRKKLKLYVAMRDLPYLRLVRPIQSTH